MIKKNILIYGIGSHYNSICNLINDIDYKINILGTIDDNKSSDFNSITEAIKITKCKNIIIAIGNGNIRKKIMQENNFCNFPNIIHPTAYIGKDVNIGCGNQIFPFSIINCNTIIGNGNIINTNSLLEHDNYINNFNDICPKCSFGGNVTIKNENFIGINTTIINNIIIGSNNIIGASSVITKNFNVKNKTIIGIPAKIYNKNV